MMIHARKVHSRKGKTDFEKSDKFNAEQHPTQQIIHTKCLVLSSRNETAQQHRLHYDPFLNCDVTLHAFNRDVHKCTGELSTAGKRYMIRCACI